VRRRQAALVRSARSAAYTCFALLTVANLAMIYGLVTHDFSIDYVAQVGSRATPVFFTVISLWSALEGSILFWGWVLAFYAALAMWLTGYRLGALGAYANATLLGVSAFFYLLLVGPANPFSAVFPVPLDGPGPNPLLQNHILMAVHPPLLYLGYVGMTVPFAFGIGALLSGRLDDTWLRVTRRWTVVRVDVPVARDRRRHVVVLRGAGLGRLLGVGPRRERVVHAVAHGHRVHAFRHGAGAARDAAVWNMTLIIATFLLTILGTFLTRSGVISSVHAFGRGRSATTSSASSSRSSSRWCARGPGSANCAARPPRQHGVARDGVPRQQPAADRVHLHRAARHAVPDPGGGARA
jgi:cytochrome c-type biogenesis protein CcmF